MNISIINTFKIPKNKMNCDAFKFELFKLPVQYTIRFNVYGQNIKLPKIDLKSNSVNFTQSIINGKTKYIISDLYKYNGIIISIFKNTRNNNNLRLLDENNNDDNLAIFSIKEFESVKDISIYDYIVEDRKINFDKYNGKYVIKFNPVIQINSIDNNTHIPYNDRYYLKLYNDNNLYKEFNLTDKKLSYNKKKFEIKYKEIKESKYNVEIISKVNDEYEINYVYYDNYTLDINKKRNISLVILAILIIPVILIIVTVIIFIILKKEKKDDKKRLNNTNESDIIKSNSKKNSDISQSKDAIINKNMDINNVENDII